ncbi:MAG: ribonuclease H-like domain-containing protein [Nanoarchaeota archaeon]
MLKKTFCHTNGITLNTENILWLSGINSWDDFFKKCENINCLTLSQIHKIKTELTLSERYLELGNLNYFRNKLPPKEHYRLRDYGKIAYVDIETTGLSKYSNDITLIGIYDGEKPHIYVRGKNLEDAKEHLRQFDIIVTFNGKLFDIPFIEHNFNEKYDIIHLDLRFMFKEIGLSGGLKKIEKSIGIKRGEDVEDIDGFEAVKLWKKYERYNDLNALKLLLKYNKEDIINLKYLLDYYIDKKNKLT